MPPNPVQAVVAFGATGLIGGITCWYSFDCEGETAPVHPVIAAPNESLVEELFEIGTNESIVGTNESIVNLSETDVYSVAKNVAIGLFTDPLPTVTDLWDKLSNAQWQDFAHMDYAIWLFSWLVSVFIYYVCVRRKRSKQIKKKAVDEEKEKKPEGSESEEEKKPEENQPYESLHLQNGKVVPLRWTEKI